MTLARPRLDRTEPVTDDSRTTATDHPDPRPRFPRATIVHIPGGLLLAGVDPDRAELVAERLARWIPGHAWTHDARTGLWTIVAPWDRTARAVALVTTGTILELFSYSYIEGRAQLERAVRWEPAGAGQVAA